MNDGTRKRQTLSTHRPQGTHSKWIAAVASMNEVASGCVPVMKTVRPYYNGHILFRGRTQDEAAQLLAFDRGADDYIHRRY